MTNETNNNMITTTQKIGSTVFTTKTIISEGVKIGVTRRVIDLKTIKTFVSGLEFSLEFGGFKKTRMNKHSFDFHLQMIKSGELN